MKSCSKQTRNPSEERFRERISIQHSNKIVTGALKGISALLFWCLIWWLLANKIGKELILPGPFAVLKEMAGMVRDGDFWRATGTTLLRVLSGYLLGIIAGAALSLITSFSKMADTFISPVIRIVRATPVASFIILALLWMGKSNVPVFMSMLMVVPVIWGNLSEEFASTDKDLLQMGRAYGFTKLEQLRHIYIPSAVPGFRAATLTSLGLAWKSGIAAEVLCQPKYAIGSDLYYSKIYLETPSLFAWTAVVIIMSYILEKLIRHIITVFEGRKVS
nr:ABC transporter permease subunit [Clostridia bacterium]